jgi:hypothetical protein
MKSDFELVLEECLAQMRGGKALEACLSAHPAQAHRLRPLLEAAAHVWALPVPRAHPVAVQAGLERLLEDARSQKVLPSLAPSSRFAGFNQHVLGLLSLLLFGRKRSTLNLAFRMAMMLMIVLLATSSITVKASSSSLPGDALYNIKRSWESIRLSLAFSQPAKQRLQEKFSEERLDEVKALIQLRRAETVEFQAPLEEIDAEHWLVDGFQVYIDSETEVEGEPETGLPVEIRARLDVDGTLNAIQVRVPAGNQPQSYPTKSPTYVLTPEMEQVPEFEDTESPQNLQEPTGENQSPQPGSAEESVEDQEETAQPTQQPEPEATQNARPHRTGTPEPTDYHDSDETHEPVHTPEPTDEHHATPDSTEQDHEIPKPTGEH